MERAVIGSGKLHTTPADEFPSPLTHCSNTAQMMLSPQLVLTVRISHFQMMMFSEQLETVQASNYYVTMVVKSYIANLPYHAFRNQAKTCIVGVSFVNSVKEWYLVHLMSARGERYPDLLIYRTGFVDCPFLLRM